ncbi:hypothetical protein HMI54_006417 [Coelomomyces lativittatus]|nr:hypothetical protein HMI54_006417 [Coelomomyces lativittatus]
MSNVISNTRAFHSSSSSNSSSLTRPTNSCLLVSKPAPVRSSSTSFASPSRPTLSTATATLKLSNPTSRQTTLTANTTSSRLMRIALIQGIQRVEGLLVPSLTILAGMFLQMSSPCHLHHESSLHVLASH